ncbi:hypothetical protein Fmac_011837 [Flemingia macrophylla]|uniref:Uncharacterized protein n=1 Tax=Flemingia macrophylla TaxID=520843 RepID=A0ABD1MNK5_9FABA
MTGRRADGQLSRGRVAEGQRSATSSIDYVLGVKLQLLEVAGKLKAINNKVKKKFMFCME